MKRTSVRLAGAVAAAMFLSSCWWVGPPFYKGNPADAGPLKPGLYDVETTNEPDQSGKADIEHGIARVAWRRDGSVRWGDPRKPKEAITFIAARLDVARLDLWVVQNEFGKPRDLRTYGLMEVRDGDLWMVPTIDCDSTADIVRAARGDVSGGMVEIAASNVVDADMVGNEMSSDDPMSGERKRTGQTCAFADRASLERALRAYVVTNPAFPVHIRFKRIGD